MSIVDMNIELWRDIFLVTLILVSYFPSFWGEFVFDDIEAIVKNVDVSDTANYLELFKHDFWGNDIASESSHKSYRPLTVLVYRVLYQLDRFVWSTLFPRQSADNLHSPMRASGHDHRVLTAQLYHILNVLVYCVLALQLLRTLRLLFKIPIFRFGNCKTDQVSLLSTIFFVTHPVHTEAVCACVGVADTLCALCCFVALKYHIISNTIFLPNPSFSKWISLQYLQPKQATFSCRKSWALIYCQILKFALISTGVLFKEQALTFLGIFILLDFVNILSLSEDWNQNNKKDDKEPLNKTRQNFVIDILLCFAFLIIILFFRLQVMNFKSPVFADQDNPFPLIESYFYRYMNFLNLYMINAFIFLCPIWLCFDWSMGCIKPIESLFDYRIFVIFSFVIFSISLLYFIRKRLDLLILVFAFVVLPFLPASNLFFRVGFVVAERNLFLSVLGFAVFVSLGCYELYERSRSIQSAKLLYNALLGYLILVFCLKNNLRSREWTSEEILFKTDLSICPNNAKIHYNIAKIEADKGKLFEASRSYENALKLYPNYTSALNNYANILKSQNRFEEARRLFQKVLEIDPKHGPALMNYAILENRDKQYSSSLSLFRKALLVRPKHAETHYNLGNLYLELKDFANAEKCYENAIKFNSKLVQAWNNLILIKHKSRQLQVALDLTTRALQFNPASESLHFNAGNIYGELGNFQLAERHFNEALNVNSNNVKYLFNLGVLYQRQKMFTKAKEFYHRVLVLKPDHVEASKQFKRL